MPGCESIWCCYDVWPTILQNVCNYTLVLQLAWWYTSHVYQLVMDCWWFVLGFCLQFSLPQLGVFQLIAWHLQLVQLALWQHVTLPGQIYLAWHIVAPLEISRHFQVGCSHISSGQKMNYYLLSWLWTGSFLQTEHTFLPIPWIDDNVVSLLYGAHPYLPLATWNLWHCSIVHYMILGCLAINISKRWLACGLSYVWQFFCLVSWLQETTSGSPIFQVWVVFKMKYISCKFAPRYK